MVPDHILQELSLDRAWQHMEWLGENAPLRISGSDADTLDKVDRERFRQTADVYAGYIWEMATSEVLPIDLVTLADDLAQRIEEVERIAGEHLKLNLTVDQLHDAVNRLTKLIDEIRDRGQHSELIPDVNRALMRVS